MDFSFHFWVPPQPGPARSPYSADRKRGQMEVDIRHYDMHDVVMGAEGRFLTLKVPGLSENRPSVLRGDKLLVAMSSAPDTTYEGFVHDVEESRVKLQFSDKLMRVATKAKMRAAYEGMDQSPEVSEERGGRREAEERGGTKSSLKFQNEETSFFHFLCNCLIILDLHRT